MKVQDTINLGNEHVIEIGDATWDSSQTSVRNRYPTSNGGFSPRSSSEIPLGDLGPIVTALAQRDLLDIATITQMIETLAASLGRLVGKRKLKPLQELLDRVTDENRHAEIKTGPAVGNEIW